MSKIGKQILDTALDSLALIGELAAEIAGADPEKAKLIADVIRAIVDSVRDGHARKISPEEVVAQIEESLKGLEQTMADDRKAARAKVDELFPPVTPTP